VICLHMETPFLVPFRYNRKKWDLIEVFREVIVGEVCTQRAMPLLLPHPALLKIWPCSRGLLKMTRRTPRQNFCASTFLVWRADDLNQPGTRFQETG